MPSKVEQALRKIVEDNHLSKHKFYRLWDEGKLTKEQLQNYSKQYFHLEFTFPNLLSAIPSHCTDLKTRQVLVQNLFEEELQGTHHADLWRQFQSGIGVSKEQHTNAKLLPQTEAALALLKQICSSKSVEEGLAAMFAYEAMLPEVSRLKVAGLKKFYGVDDPKTVEFFTTHYEADQKHSNAWIELLSKTEAEYKQSDTNEAQEKLEKAALDTCGALNLFLDGVLAAYVH